jgi:hypothetical protein
MSEANIQTDIGLGSYGGVIGSWSHGEVMGEVVSGELFAAYNLGNTYTSGVSADIVTNNGKRTAVYSVTSNDVKIYADGIARLENGTATISFDRNFTDVISKEGRPTITITPVGECSGICILRMDANGFTVKELNNGTSSVEFSWIAIGRRADITSKPELPADLAEKDFDKNIKGMMFNESNKDKNATPVWWDGSKLRFDAPPADKKGGKKQ